MSSLAAPAVSADADTMIRFTMPRFHARPGLALPDSGNPLSDGYRRWELAYSTRAKACRDSGSAWCADTANWHIWIPQARTLVVLASGYERPGYTVSVRRPAVVSLYWPYSVWARTWTDTASAWQLVGTYGSNN